MIYYARDRLLHLAPLKALSESDLIWLTLLVVAHPDGEYILPISGPAGPRLQPRQTPQRRFPILIRNYMEISGLGLILCLVLHFYIF